VGKKGRDEVRQVNVPDIDFVSPIASINIDNGLAIFPNSKRSESINRNSETTKRVEEDKLSYINQLTNSHNNLSPSYQLIINSR